MGGMPKAPWASALCLKDPNRSLNFLFPLRMLTISVHTVMTRVHFLNVHFVTLYHRTHVGLILLTIPSKLNSSHI